MSIHDDEFTLGYRDGRDPSAPEPSSNRSNAYQHSFAVGRAEIMGQPIPAHVSRVSATEAERRDAMA